MCTRDSTYQNPNSSQINTKIRTSSSSKCRKLNGFYPSFTPIINSLSTTTSSYGIYSHVYINGSNFLPGSIYVNFGPFKQLPIIFYSSFNISFVVPLNAIQDTYNVIVVNVYNDNFSPSINQSYPGNLNYSNIITYTIT